MTTKPIHEHPKVIPLALQSVAATTGVPVREIIKKHDFDIPSCRRIAWARNLVCGLLREIGTPGRVIARTLQMSAGGTSRLSRRHGELMKTEKVYLDRYEAARRMWVTLTKETKNQTQP